MTTTRASRRCGACCATARRKLTQRLAHHSYLDGVAALGLLDRIPDFGEVSDKLRKLTGWEIVAVPGPDSRRRRSSTISPTAASR